MSDHRLYCNDCERRTAHSDYGAAEMLATCDVCDYLRYLPTDDKDNNENECIHAHEQASLVETATAGVSDS